MNKKAITTKALEQLVDQAIYKEAEEENIEIGHALKVISDQGLKKILNGDRKKRSFNRLLWERIGWSIAVAALIAVAITVPISVENSSKDKICDMVYAYNSSQIEELLSHSSRSAGENIPDITGLSDEKLKEIMPKLQDDFLNSDNPQDVAFRGKILALSYIRLHKRKEAKETLEAMINKLSFDEDYETTVKECRELLEQIK